MCTYSKPDSYCLVGNKVIQIHNFVLETNGTTAVIGKEYERYNSLYNYPLDSSLLNIYIVHNLCNAYKTYNLSDVQCKCIVYEFEGKCISFPMLHTL